MKRFSFSLETVLQHRLEKEEKAVLEQFLAQSEYQKQMNVLDNINTNLNLAKNAGTDSMTAGDFMARFLYVDYLDKARARQEEAVKRAAGELERKRLGVVEARQDKMVLQKLKEKLYRQYISDVNWWENKTNDDFCTGLTHRVKGVIFE